ncbi:MULTISPECIES: dihydrofolate reductase family protein [unclassified Amycolatopsis]|uniref:dihydrofolate reductase family protein n=1 Tax=unclassified Amycolatopsis TaxID=2618356 RepID=UPI002E12ABDB|nr:MULTISPECIES: dihydrofolate reductase family protein [unclassified Amycolatopsis]WSK81477.1 dihydrofolate reductase family protein [Amycolatopsis sp. NBC_01286]
MAELIVTTFLSLDGVYQGPGGVEEDPSGGFDQGGWVTPFYEDDMAAYAAEWLGQAGSLLIGRRTYDIFVQYWPKATDQDDPVAVAMNNLPKYVVSRTLSGSDWSGVSVVDGDVVEFVRELKARPGGEIQVHGSGDLLQTLIAHDLVDEYRLWLYPVVLGQGRKLFPEGVAPKSFEHVETRRTSSGANVLVLRPAGKPRHDTFRLVTE